MPTMAVNRMLMFGLLTCLGAAAWAQEAAAPAHDEAALRQRYDAYIAGLDHATVAADYPKLVQDLTSPDPAIQMTAIRTLGETGDPRVIPWLVPCLDADDGKLRVSAGSAIEKVVSAVALGILYLANRLAPRQAM